MAYHALPATVSAVLCVTSAACLFRLTTQPHDAPWYAEVFVVFGLTWAFGVTVYNLAFHPLAKYPGPLFAACTDWYNVYHISKGDRHVAVHHEHLKHGIVMLGKFVRMGPNRLSINSPAAYRNIHDVNANTLKSDVFRIFKRIFGEDSSMTTVDHKIHAFRRRVNMTALTPQGIKALEPRVVPHIDYMIEQILQKAGTSDDGERGWSPGIDLSLAIRYLIADIMGDMVFSRGWNVQRDAKNRTMVEKMNNAIGGLFLLGHMPILLTLGLHWILFWNRMYHLVRLMLWAQATTSWRAQQDEDLRGAHDRDIWSVLLNAQDPKTGRSFSAAELRSEAFMFITAGTDTMISTICATFFHLVHDPARLERATREVRDTFPAPSGIAGHRSAAELHCSIPWGGPELTNMTYLTACMDEGLRLGGGVVGHLQRRVGPGGTVIDDEWLPEDTDVAASHYSMMRSPDHFDDPLEFVPERWLGVGDGDSSSDSKTARRDRRQAEAFTPFGVGRYSCIGKHLAYQEVLMILARLLWFFDVRQEPGNTLGEGSGKSLEAGRDRKNEYQRRDQFVGDGRGPAVQFRLRKGFTA